MFDFKIERSIAEISNTGRNAKQLNLVSWNGAPAKLDLRVWRTDEEPAKPGKGVTLNEEEAQTLVDALTDYLSGLDRAEA